MRRRRPLGCEILEHRRLLAVTAVAHDDIGYLVNVGGQRIERYDLTDRSWLPSIELAGATAAPTAIAVGGTGVFVAFGRTVYRYSPDGGSRTHLLNTSAATTELLLDGPLLFVNTLADRAPAVTTIDTRTNAIVGTFTDWWVRAPHGASIAPGVNRIFGRSTGISPSDIVTLEYRDDGVITGGKDSPYHGDFPDAERTWVLPGGTLVVDDSGTVYRTADLSRATSLGSRIDELAFRGDGVTISRRGSRLTAYDAALLPTAEAELGYVPDGIFGAGDAVVAFTVDAASAHGFREDVVPAWRFAAPAPGPAVDPVTSSFIPETVTVAADGSLLLFDRELASMFRWDVDSARYTQSVPLIGNPRFFAYSPTTDTAYLAGESGLIRSLGVSAATPRETAFAVLATAPGGLATAGKYLFAEDASGAWSTHSTFAPDGVLVDSKDWNYRSDEFVWSAANQRMYFLRDDTTPNDLLWEEINADGVRYPQEPSGGIGRQQDSPLHDSAGFQHPIRVAPDGSVVVLGSGAIHDGLSLARMPIALPNPVVDATWLSGDLYTIRAVADGTEVQRLTGPTYEPVASATIPGAPVALVGSGGRLVAVTAGTGSTTSFARFDATLAAVGASPVTVSIRDAVVAEGDAGGRQAVFPVALSRPSAVPVLVSFFTEAGSAVPGRDFTASRGFLTFQPGETRKDIVVATIGDRLDEANEFFSVRLEGVTGAVLGRAVGTGTILDDDPLPVLTVRDVSLAEGSVRDGIAVFMLNLSAASGRSVSVAYATASGGATAGVDFKPVAGIATIAPGQTLARVSVPITADTVFETDETFLLKLTGPEHCTLPRDAATGTIRNDDRPPVMSAPNVRVVRPLAGVTWASFAITLSAAAGVPVTVRYATADASARSGADYAATSGAVVFSPGETTKAIFVAILPGASGGARKSFVLGMSASIGGRVERMRAEATIIRAGTTAGGATTSRWPTPT